MRVIYKITRPHLYEGWTLDRIVFIKKWEIIKELNHTASQGYQGDVEVKFFGDKKEALEYIEENGGLLS